MSNKQKVIIENHMPWIEVHSQREFTDEDVKSLESLDDVEKVFSRERYSICISKGKAFSDELVIDNSTLLVNSL